MPRKFGIRSLADKRKAFRKKISNFDEKKRKLFPLLVADGDFAAILDDIDNFIRLGVDFNLRADERIGVSYAHNGQMNFLEWLAAHRKHEAFEKILATGVDFNGLSPTGHTLLTANASFDNLITKLLLEHGADPNKANAAGLLPMNACLISAWQGSERAVEGARLLLKYGADPDLPGSPAGLLKQEGITKPISSLDAAKAMRGIHALDNEHLIQIINMLQAKHDELALIKEFEDLPDAPKGPTKPKRFPGI